MTEAEKAEWIAYAAHEVELNRQHDAERDPQTPDEHAHTRLA